MIHYLICGRGQKNVIRLWSDDLKIDEAIEAFIGQYVPSFTK